MNLDRKRKVKRIPNFYFGAEPEGQGRRKYLTNLIEYLKLKGRREI